MLQRSRTFFTLRKKCYVGCKRYMENKFNCYLSVTSYIYGTWDLRERRNHFVRLRAGDRRKLLWLALLHISTPSGFLILSPDRSDPRTKDRHGDRAFDLATDPQVRARGRSFRNRAVPGRTSFSNGFSRRFLEMFYGIWADLSVFENMVIGASILSKSQIFCLRIWFETMEY